ncbi:MBL fold metallo-hydrolase [Neptunomonas marina]|uniref:MBL fold metallo-hydrolase n=1 Tax=Neptunomonas marina TaxID=1815562 RepID=A0A437Q3W2_9GAMM|nr:MBL fold metallo-hydrolase [Neptunomonas marina]RVU29227.1 MBL fold metallo-hydrolase [Neptunomonas marina]
MKFSVVPVTAFQQNCTIAWCEQTCKAAVIDPGGDISQITKVLEQNDLTLEKILLTHGHIDHAGGTAELAAQFGVPIEGPHRGDSFWIEQLAQQSQMFGFPQVESFEPTRWLEDGDTVLVGNSVLQVLHCPGHTPGHVVFYDAESNVAQVGDVLFQGSIGRTDFPGGNHDELLHSITEKLFALGDGVRFIPGHGPQSTLGHERKTNPFVAGRHG